MKVAVIVPAYNEGERIANTIKSLKEALSSDIRILVIDDGSQDNTADEAEKAGAEVIRMGVNSGKGEALNRGLKEAQADAIAFIDADLEHTAGEAAKLIAPVAAGEADMTIARFPKARKKGGFGIVKGSSRWIIKHYTGLEMESPLSGQRVLTKQLLNVIGEMPSGYGVEVGLTIMAARKGFRVIEVPVQMYHNESERTIKGFMHRGKQLLHVLKAVRKTLKACR